MIHFLLRIRRIPRGIFVKLSAWTLRQTQKTGASRTRPVRAVRGTAVSQRGARSMTEAMRESPPARRTPVIFVMSKARMGTMTALMAHIMTAIRRA